MLKRFNEIIKAQAKLLKGKSFYLAISGGKDSMTLSHLLINADIPHTLLHCNFKLRNQDSDEDEKFILNYAAANGLKVYSTQFNTKEYAIANKLTTQEAARNLRYDWFKTFIKDEDSLLLTAHHQDDNIETFFINLMRGTSIQGLTGIAANKNNIFRPLLKFSQNEINEYVEQNAVPYRQDLSNFESKYLRNDLRNNIIPLIESKTENFKQKVNQTIDSIDSLTQWANQKSLEFKDQFFKTSGEDLISIEIPNIIHQADIFKEFLFKEYGVYRATIPELNKFLNSETGAIFSTKSHTLHLNRTELLIERNKLTESTFSIQIDNLPFETIFDNQSLKFHLLEEKPIKIKSNNPQYLDFEKIKFPLILRKWKQGDRIQPLGMKGNKLVSDILINKKFSRIEKDQILVLVSNTTIISIINLVISDNLKITNQTEYYLAIESL